MELGERIRERLELLGISQAELARQVGVRQPTIAKLIAGKSRSSSHLHRIARALSTTPAYLEGETDDPESQAPDAPELSPDEQRLLEIFRQLGKEDRAALKQVMLRMAPSDLEEERARSTVHAPQQDYRPKKD